MNAHFHTVVVSGSRTFDVTKPDGHTFRYPNARKAAGQWLGGELKRLKAEYGDRLRIMQGGAHGPDTWARKWAEREGVEVVTMRPDYGGAKNKKLAPLERNTRQAEEGDECLAVWDGGSRGTGHQIKEFERLKKPVAVRVFDPDQLDGKMPSPPPSKEEPVNDYQDAQYEDEDEQQSPAGRGDQDEPEPKMTSEQTALARQQHREYLQSVPLDGLNNLDQAMTVAKTLCRSRLVPKAIQDDPADTLLTIWYGREYGLSPVLATQKLFVTPDGKVGMLADTMHGLVLKSGLCEYFALLEASDEAATFVTKRKGGKNEQKFTFTFDMAAKQGLTKKGHSRGKKNNWDKMPMQMLIARAKAALARLAYPDVVGGLYTYEELMDERQAEVVDLGVVSAKKAAKEEGQKPKDLAVDTTSKAAGVAPQDAEWDLDSL